ncbi:type III-B CRISPR module-associated protein Cmr5 [Thermococcus siculi]|uniref:CRISPR type III-B/RAMP module-associated protein Cmr5 n=1 Tax=Thermococcus siculi TaxID=72803 RepID=A0A2Z2MPE5_9EURY|nr:type III-B CRISPR module-associated protein Cmr5 [Thermococcus siculi]ASJ09261.1 type III-B CRISPR module-associated protein Cmr5 [Thermococcus siculi]
MDLRSIEQERAKFAYKKVLKVKKENEKDTKTQSRYRSYVESAPIMILTNGLGQTLAFYLSKLEKPVNVFYKDINPEDFTKAESKAYAYLYRHLSEWLVKEVTGGEDPLQYYIKKSGMDAILLTEEAIAFLNWLKKFARAMLEEDKTAGG